MTFTIRTGSDGFHPYLWTPVPLRCRIGFLPGVDFKGEGGYVVGPGSLHPNGKRYRVEINAPIAPMPAALLELLRDRPAPPPKEPPAAGELRSSAYIRRAIEAECARLAAAPGGERNVQLNRSAFALARFVANGEADAEPIVRVLAYTAAAIGLEPREIPRTIASGFRGRGVEV